MWPWGHLALGYLCYHVYARRSGEAVDASAVAALALGTQLPDLVDKPLAWSLGVLPGGRSLAHSLLFGVGLALAAVALARRFDRRDLAAPLLVGYASHLLGDSVAPIIEGAFHELAFLAWPLLALPEPSTEPSFGAHVATIGPSPMLVVEFALVGLAAVAWLRDGKPGWGALLTVLRRTASASSR
ncbi:metal-dependent hydrolase [Halomarina halobia]|uniref:Metal-dependent hydrolase n=1 Tax=Halomarina halobia TaxID=3033386 RepID=A0ABD6A7E4_9EURY|nr:metal-dependent hydrolase [Halomarina sp. PSR21]